MKKQLLTRGKDRWEHALTRPLRGLNFELIELMRRDLFEYLDVLTTCLYDDKKSKRDRTRDLRRIAERLVELTSYRAKAAREALEAGRIGHNRFSDDGSFPPPIAIDLQKYWEGVVLSDRSGG